MFRQRVRSNTKAGVEYEVTEDGGVWSCTCEGFARRARCSHIDKLQAGKDKAINEYFVKITQGRAVIGSALAIDEDVDFVVQGTVVKKSDLTNNDGTYDVIYEVKARSVAKLSELISRDGSNGKIKIEGIGS